MRHLFLDTKLTSVHKLVENGPRVEKKSEVEKRVRKRALVRRDSSGMMATKAELILESKVGRRFSKGVPCELLHEELTRGLEIKTKMSNTRSDLRKGGQ
jgi:hypothetical protein